MSENAAAPTRRILPGVGLTDFTATRQFGRQTASALLVAAAYYLTGYFGVAAKVPPVGFATTWPPAAVLLAALLLTPRRLWWTYLITVGPAHVYLFLQCLPTMPGMTLGIQSIGYAAQAVLAAEAVRYFDGAPPRLDNLRGMTRFILLAAVAAPALTSTFVVYAYTHTGWVADYWLTWRQRVMSNVVPTITLTPFIILAIHGGLASFRRTTLRRVLEFAALMLAMIAVALAVFRWTPAGHEIAPALLYALLPLLLWAAVRFEPVCLYFCLVTIALVSLVNAVQGHGPFLTLSRPANVLGLQLFLVAISVPLIMLSALVQERRRTESALRESKQRYRLATAAGSAGVWDWNIATDSLYLDPALKAMLGFADHEVDNTMEGWIRCMHPGDVDRVMAQVRAHLDGITAGLDVEHRSIHADGTVHWLLCRGVVVERADGVAVRLMGTDTDITERKSAEQALHKSSEKIRELAGRLISAQEQERRRIARDLHDDLNQKVAALSIEISHVKLQFPGSDGSFIEKLDRLQGRTTELVDDIRKLSHRIHPATLEHAGLVPALISLATELNRLEGIELDLRLPEGRERIPQDVAIGMYRIAQESIRNVVRHSGARHAVISLTLADDVATLVVEDEGRGFDVALTRENGGLGLISIEERVRLLDGHFEVASQQGRGTRLRIQVPLASRPHEHS